MHGREFKEGGEILGAFRRDWGRCGSHKESIVYSTAISGDNEDYESTVALTCGSVIFSSSTQCYNHFLKPSSMPQASENGACVVC